MMTPEQFWQKVNKTDTCWLWTGKKSHTHGYGVVRVTEGKGKRPETGAHRFAYELVNGKVPAGLVLDHLCRVRLCVRPEHLEVVTVRENTLRGNGITAHNAAKTHCKRGHEFTLENTMITKQGRFCRTCGRARATAYYHKNKA